MQTFRMALAASALSLCGCLTHMEAATKDYMGIDWVHAFGKARQVACATGRPILLCLVAGDLLDPC